MWHLDCKDELIRAGTWTTKKIGKRRVRPCPKVDLKQMLDGDVPQNKMTCLFFVKEGIRKLSDLNTVIGNNTQFILIYGTLIARTS